MFFLVLLLLLLLLARHSSSSHRGVVGDVGVVGVSFIYPSPLLLPPPFSIVREEGVKGNAGLVARDVGAVPTFRSFPKSE